jgi:hypothetical protein
VALEVVPGDLDRLEGHDRPEVVDEQVPVDGVGVVEVGPAAVFGRTRGRPTPATWT